MISIHSQHQLITVLFVVAPEQGPYR
ncbi:rCG40425 [Rattus norvegicus]|uniref:RCG40425 n=1 Tax=Rattus norvegicus TaxID=10116 RepID=A6I5Z4_RAT|nr:rCG40425 [Rattus norvegicus]